MANTINSSGEEYVLLIWADFELAGVFGPYATPKEAEAKGKVFEGAGWVTTVMKLGKPGDIDQEREAWGIDQEREAWGIDQE